MPKLAVFPKGFVTALAVTHEMSLLQWLDLAATLDVDGVELYPPFFAGDDDRYFAALRRELDERGLAMPMMCYSPDFTTPDDEARRREVTAAQRMLDICVILGARQCRVLSGQARPGISREQGLAWATAGIEALLDHAERTGVFLAIENHYKDGFWEYREFAQKMDLFLELLERIPSPWLRVNYDPSNAILAGDDPILLLEAVKDRLISMHASDRYLTGGTLESLRQADGTLGYPENLHHGIIGRGLNDYDRIFGILRDIGFDGWISIEDGDGGMEPMRESAAFLRAKMAQYFGG